MRQLLVRIAMKLGVYKWCVDVDTNLRERRIARAFRKYGLETCVAAFQQNEHIDEIAMHPDHKAEAKTLLSSDRFPKVRYWIDGGKERWESSLHAINVIADAVNGSMAKSSINGKSSLVQSSIKDGVNVLSMTAPDPLSVRRLSRTPAALSRHTKPSPWQCRLRIPFIRSTTKVLSRTSLLAHSSAVLKRRKLSASAYFGKRLMDCFKAPPVTSPTT